MAKPNTIPYVDAIEGIKLSKKWLPGNRKITWVQQSKKSWPYSYKAYVGVLTSDVLREGTRVELYHKKSTVLGVPDTIYMNFIYQNAIVFAVHDGGPTRHINKVGKGKEFYQQAIGHPHKHIPVPESSYGYAEPLTPMSIDKLWCLFRQEANIIGDIKFEYPDDIQGSLL